MSEQFWTGANVGKQKSHCRLAAGRRKGLVNFVAWEHAIAVHENSEGLADVLFEPNQQTKGWPGIDERPG